MSDLIKNQRPIAQRISRVVRNLKKEGKANLSPGMLRTHRTIMETLWNEFIKGDANSQKAAEAELKLLESGHFKNDEYGEVQMVYGDQARTLLNWINEKESAANVDTDGNSNGLTVDATPTRSRAVLPKMSLPSFDGQYKNWPTFKDSNTSLILNDLSLSPVERLHHLKSCLQGDAASLLKHIATTSDSFAVAWDKLYRRFNNPRLLVQAQIRGLTYLQPMTKESATQMKQLFNETFGRIDALENLNHPVTNATDWIVELTVDRWDPRSKREWEDWIQDSKDLPTLEQLKTIMEKRIRTCEALEASPIDEPPRHEKTISKPSRIHQVSTAGGAKSATRSCGLCHGNQFILFCTRHREKNPVARRDAVRSLGLCLNCLGTHSENDCKSTKRCLNRNDKHHSTIHEAVFTATLPQSSLDFTIHHASQLRTTHASVLLSIALFRVAGPREPGCLARALIDSGSEVSLIFEALAQRLGVKRTQARVPLLGVGEARTQFTRGRTTLDITPHSRGDVNIRVSALVLPELSRYRPRNLPSVTAWPHLQGLTLADPQFQRSDPVDILLGADTYKMIMCDGVKRGSPRSPVAQETLLGWILTGGVDAEVPCHALVDPGIAVNSCQLDRELMNLLTRFWEQEEVDAAIPLTADEQMAEDHFAATHTRQPDRRYQVRMPFSGNPDLGDSQRIASRTLESLTARFKRLPQLHHAYAEFLSEYEQLGHMTATQSSPESSGYVLPHHEVLRETSATTKLEVVFNGSMPSSNGRSLNDCLLRGPNLLPHLFDALLRWRKNRYVFAADIEKMYRQIVMHPEDRRWQRILWRPNDSNSILTYELNTATYGLACAPFLAIRSLQQLALDEEARFPVGASIVMNDVYVDDVLTVADTLSDARQRQSELRDLLMAGGFPLRKWASNAPELLNGLSCEERKGLVE